MVYIPKVIIKVSVFEYDLIKSLLFEELHEGKADQIVLKSCRNILKRMKGIKADH
jgi:hypothetical protein